MEKAIAVKTHETPKGRVVAACDIGLVGKSLRDGEMKLHVCEEFYFEKSVGPEELESLLEDCFTANLVGKKTVEAYCRANPDAEVCVMTIDDTPHLQIFTV